MSGFQASGCSITDAKCACTSDAFLDQVQQCISASCNTADQVGTFQVLRLHIRDSDLLSDKGA